MTPADRIAELEAKLLHYESATGLPEEPARIPGSMNLYVPRADYDKLRDYAVAIKAENDELHRVNNENICNLQTLYKRAEKAEAVVAEANKRIHELAEAYARLFTEKEFAGKQLATARQEERERCAKVCERQWLRTSDTAMSPQRQCAEAIRALTDEGAE